MPWGGRANVTVTISGPYHDGRHVTYATLQNPTVEQVKAALAAAKAEWEAERKMKQSPVEKLSNLKLNSFSREETLKGL